jgi:iron-sulfur cluster insertion protein
MDKTFHITSAAHRHISAVATQDRIPPILRIKVDSGGCSGFKYIFEFVHAIEPDDHVFEDTGVKVVVDAISWTFLMEGELDFIEEMMGSYFVFKNPNAQSSCGCGSSFSI